MYFPKPNFHPGKPQPTDTEGVAMSHVAGDGIGFALLYSLGILPWQIGNMLSPPNPGKNKVYKALLTGIHTFHIYTQPTSYIVYL